MKEITTLELKAMMDKKEEFTLLDCRGVDYFNWEHLPGAVNLRWKFVGDRAAKLLPDKKTPLVTYCDGFACNASVHCYENLEKLGYKNIIEYPGGIADWKAHGYKTIEDKRFKLALNVYRFPEQEFYGEPVGSYLIVEDDFVLLIDGPQHLTEEHEDFILHQRKPIKVFMTHDPTAGDTKILQQKHGAKIYLHKADKDGERLTVAPDIFIDDGFKFNDHLIVIHTPGHSPGSSCLYDAKNKIMFTGDHVEGTEKGEIYNFFADKSGTTGDVDLRFASAKELLKYDFEKILPFHYEVITKNAKQILGIFIKKRDNVQ